jgi:DNA (cytosine-5)-methyltransferase 1
MHRDLSEFVHPKLDRWITVREALRLQSFHDGFVPITSEWQQLKQIGNAVPPLLGRAVGMAARELLEALLTRRASRAISVLPGHQLSLFARGSSSMAVGRA